MEHRSSISTEYLTNALPTTEQILQSQHQQFQVIPATLLDLPVPEPIAGRKYDDLKSCATEVFDRFVGLCTGHFHTCAWNPLTQNLLVCDIASCCIRSFKVHTVGNNTSEVKRQLTLGDFVFGGKGNTVGKFMEPTAIDVSAKGEIAVSDRKLCRIQIFNGRGQLMCHFGRQGTLRGQFRDISAIKFTLQGYVAIVDSGNHRIQVMTQTGNLVMIFGKPGHKPFGGELFFPTAMDIHPRSGEFFVLDYGNRRVQRFSNKGKFMCSWGRQATVCQNSPEPSPQSGLRFGEEQESVKKIQYKSIFESPSDLIVGPYGEIVVCDPARQALFVFTPLGTCLHTVSFQKVKTPVSIAMTKDFILAVMFIRPHMSASPPETPKRPLNGIGTGGSTAVSLPPIGLSEIATSITTANSSLLSSSRSPSLLATMSSSRTSVLSSHPSLLLQSQTATQSQLPPDIPIQNQIQTHVLETFGTCELIKTGPCFEEWPLSSIFQVISYLNYREATLLRQANRFLHRSCYQARCQWLLCPLKAGQKSVFKYGKCLQEANGFEKVKEVFTKWAFALDKTNLDIHTGAMEFENGFLQAISVLYGPVYTYQHEDILQELFTYFCNLKKPYRKQVKSSQMIYSDFFEIVTLLEENRHGLVKWQQMRAFSGNNHIPPLRTGDPPLVHHVPQSHSSSNNNNNKSTNNAAVSSRPVTKNLYSLEVVSKGSKGKGKAQAAPVDPAQAAAQEALIAKEKAKVNAAASFRMMEHAESHQLDKLLGKLRNL